MLIIWFLLISGAHNFVFENVKTPKRTLKGNPGRPLFLTHLLREGRIKEAQERSRVHLKEFEDLKSHSGFLTVDSIFNSNLFFWFFPSEGNWQKDPVVLWLQGGPGASSLLGLFVENGPINVTNKGKAFRRKYSWTKNHSVLYIDSPVGTGFSFTNVNGFARNETVVANNLYEALIQFFTLFPNLKTNEFYIFGESYGGKYVPAISYKILQNDPDGKVMNWQGSGIGNGLTDPIHQMNYGQYLYEHGLIDWNIRKEADRYMKAVKNYIENKEWMYATSAFTYLVTTVINATGLKSPYNYYNPVPFKQTLSFVKYITDINVRASIHVGYLSYHALSSKVNEELANDVIHSVAPWVSEILSHRRLLIYNGQLDMICPYPLTVNYLRHLNFTSAKEYETAPRYQWKVDGLIAGYSKTAGNLTEVLVRDAGHLVPYDQPRSAFDLITRFTRNKPFH